MLSIESKLASIIFPDFPKCLKNLRESNSLKQREMGIILDITTEHYNRLENGKARPTFEHIEKLFTVFKVNPDILLGVREDKIFSSIAKQAALAVEELELQRLKELALALIDTVKSDYEKRKRTEESEDVSL